MGFEVGEPDVEKQPAPRSARILLRGGFIITADKHRADLRGDLLIEDGRIAAIAPRIDAGSAEVVDASRFIVMPGFVDCHRHLWQTVMRHTGTDWDLPQMFVEMFVKFAPRMSPDDVYAASLFGRLCALDAGITTLLDWAHVQNTPAHSDENIRALRDAGGRSIFGHGQPGTEPQAWMAGSTRNHPDDIRRVRKDVLPSDDGLLTMAMACRGPEFCTMPVVEHDIRLARELGLRTTMHIGMGEKGASNRAIEKLHRSRLLGPDVTCLHCCTSGDDELKMLCDDGATAAVSATMAMTAGGFGLPATGRLIAQGLRPAISTDSEMSASGDFFTEMRAALTCERAIVNNGIPNGPPRAKLTARDVIEFATLEGARAVGMDRKIGSLTEGKRADLILIGCDALNLAPMIDPYGSLVMGGHAGNVDAVFVDGRAVKWNGTLVGVDLAPARKLLAQSCERLYGQTIQ